MLLDKNNVAMVSDFGLSRDVYESGEYENTSGVWKYTLMITIKLLIRGHPRDQKKKAVMPKRRSFYTAI